MTGNSSLSRLAFAHDRLGRADLREMVDVAFDYVIGSVHYAVDHGVVHAGDLANASDAVRRDVVETSPVELADAKRALGET